MVERGKAKTQITEGDLLRVEEAHQKVCMAKDLCPGFMDYFWMGHFYHKVRVPRKRDMEGRASEKNQASCLPGPSGFGGISLLTLALEGSGMVGAF